MMVTKREYDKAVLLSDFLAKAKTSIEKNSQISDVHFVPKINGYEIMFSNRSHVMKISLCFEKRFSNKLKIKIFEDKILNTSFISTSDESNTEILNKIFN